MREVHFGTGIIIKTFMCFKNKSLRSYTIKLVCIM